MTEKTISSKDDIKRDDIDVFEFVFTSDFWLRSAEEQNLIYKNFSGEGIVDWSFRPGKLNRLFRNMLLISKAFNSFAKLMVSRACNRDCVRVSESPESYPNLKHMVVYNRRPGGSPFKMDWVSDISTHRTARYDLDWIGKCAHLISLTIESSVISPNLLSDLVNLKTLKLKNVLPFHNVLNSNDLHPQVLLPSSLETLSASCGCDYARYLFFDLRKTPNIKRLSLCYDIADMISNLTSTMRETIKSNPKLKGK